MLAAEGYIRQSNFIAAMPLINITRTANGLPAIAGIAAATDVIGPDAIHCVPHQPLLGASRSSGTVTCGTIMEAMKWEKRWETAWTGPYMWYTDGRGWGDLPLNTALMWPMPYQEIDARQTFPNPPPYATPGGNYGGGGQFSAALGTYGLQ